MKENIKINTILQTVIVISTIIIVLIVYNIRFLKFIAYFVFFGAINIITNYLFRPANILSGFMIASGVSFGISFYDLMFYRKE